MQCHKGLPVKDKASREGSKSRDSCRLCEYAFLDVCQKVHDYCLAMMELVTARIKTKLQLGNGGMSSVY